MHAPCRARSPSPQPQRPPRTPALQASPSRCTPTGQAAAAVEVRHTTPQSPAPPVATPHAGDPRPPNGHLPQGGAHPVADEGPLEYLASHWDTGCSWAQELVEDLLTLQLSGRALLAALLAQDLTEAQLYMRAVQECGLLAALVIPHDICHKYALPLAPGQAGSTPVSLAAFGGPSDTDRVACLIACMKDLRTRLAAVSQMLESCAAKGGLHAGIWPVSAAFADGIERTDWVLRQPWVTAAPKSLLDPHTEGSAGWSLTTPHLKQSTPPPRCRRQRFPAPSQLQTP